jgi:hypothetical protein
MSVSTPGEFRRENAASPIVKTLIASLTLNIDRYWDAQYGILVI